MRRTENTISREIELYLEEKYAPWLRFAAYHCRAAGLAGHQADLLHELLLQMLTTNRALLPKLFAAKINSTTELDLFMLKMIKLNAHSPTAPYRRSLHRQGAQGKQNQVPKPVQKPKEKQSTASLAANADAQSKVLARSDIYPRMQKVRRCIEQSPLPALVREAFLWRYIGESFDNWPGTESRAHLYRCFNKAIGYIRLQHAH